MRANGSVFQNNRDSHELEGRSLYKGIFFLAFTFFSILWPEDYYNSIVIQVVDCSLRVTFYSATKTTLMLLRECPSSIAEHNPAIPESECLSPQSTKRTQYLS